MGHARPMPLWSRQGADRPADWKQGQRALAGEVARVATLLRTTAVPDTPALGDWTVAEVAMHLSQAWLAVPGLARQDLSPLLQSVPAWTGRRGPSLIDDMWDLGDATREGVDSDLERDLAVLAARIEARSAEYLAEIDRGLAGDRRAWLVHGAEVPLPTLTFHLLNETVVHGWDMARASGVKWTISPRSAAMIIDWFLVPVLQALPPRAMVDQVVAAGLRASFELDIKGGGRHLLSFDDGALSVESPPRRPADCRIVADPVALLLVIWGRMPQAPAIVDRRLVVSGPQAWLGPRLRSLMRNP